jgi:hypothetical protein
MAASGCRSGVVGYNVLTAVDTENHLIAAHDVSSQVSKRRAAENCFAQEPFLGRL